MDDLQGFCSNAIDFTTSVLGGRFNFGLVKISQNTYKVAIKVFHLGLWFDSLGSKYHETVSNATRTSNNVKEFPWLLRQP